MDKKKCTFIIIKQIEGILVITTDTVYGLWDYETIVLVDNDPRTNASVCSSPAGNQRSL